MNGLRGWSALRAVLSLGLLLLAGCSLPSAAAPTAMPVPATVAVAAPATATATIAAASAAPSVAATATAVPMPTAITRPTAVATAATPPVAAAPGTPATPAAAATTTPAAAAVGPQTIRDARQACELMLPAGFAATSNPGGFASSGGKVLIVLQSLSAGSDNGLDDLALPFVGAFIPTVAGYEQTAVIKVADSLRIDFTGGLPQPGRGTLYFRQFGPTICVVTYFVADGAGIAYDAVFDALVASLRPRGVG